MRLLPSRPLRRRQADSSPPRGSRQGAWIGSIAVAIGLVLALLPEPAFAERSEETVTLLVVVSGGSKTHDLSRQQLKRIFTSQPVTGPDGKRYVPLNHPPRTPDRVGFDRAVLGMNPDQVGRFWIDRRIRGGERPPRTVDNVTTLRRMVERLPGAIAYLRESQLGGDIEAIRVDGKRPGESSYPIVYRR